MSAANPGWSSPRIVGELRKLGIDVAKSTVEKYRVRSRKPPSPTWKAFLNNHVRDLVAIDFFVVATVRNKVLFVLVVLAHHRRRVVHFNVSEHPTRPVDWSADHRGFSLGHGTEISTAGLGCCLWEPIPEARQKHGYRRGALSATKPLAECICRTRDWQHPTRLPGSCHRVERSSFEANPDQLFQLLSLLVHASVARDG